MSIAAERGAERRLVRAREYGGLGVVSIAAERGAERRLVRAREHGGLGVVSIAAERRLVRAIGEVDRKDDHDE